MNAPARGSKSGRKHYFRFIHKTKTFSHRPPALNRNAVPSANSAPAWVPSTEFSACVESVAIGYSIDALSRLSVVASTIGLMTPFALTFRQAGLPLASARRSVGPSCSRVSTSSP